LKRVLHSLSCGKYKVIEKSPKSNTIKVTDLFVAAPKFQSKMLKVSLDDTVRLWAVMDAGEYQHETRTCHTNAAR
jgi:hypothetical protein